MQKARELEDGARSVELPFALEWMSPRVTCSQTLPLDALEDRDCLEIVARHDAHDDIRRRLDQYGVFDRQMFPDLDGIAKWLKYRMFECDGHCEVPHAAT